MGAPYKFISYRQRVEEVEEKSTLFSPIEFSMHNRGIVNNFFNAHLFDALLVSNLDI